MQHDEPVESKQTRADRSMVGVPYLHMALQQAGADHLVVKLWQKQQPKLSTDGRWRCGACGKVVPHATPMVLHRCKSTMWSSTDMGKYSLLSDGDGSRLVCVLCKDWVGHTHVCTSMPLNTLVVDYTAMQQLNPATHKFSAGDIAARDWYGHLVVMPSSNRKQPLHLYIAPSTIQGAGRGVFAAQLITVGTEVIWYTGQRVQPGTDTKHLAVLTISNRTAYDPSEVGGAAVLINGAHGQLVNLELQVKLLHGKTHGVSCIAFCTCVLIVCIVKGCVCCMCVQVLVATNDINIGDELFWDYQAVCDVEDEQIKCMCGCGGYLVAMKTK